MAMRRRKLVLIAAATLLGLVVVVIAGVALWSQSRSGLAFARGFVERQLAQRVDGAVHVGRLSGSLLGGSLTLDSLELRDANDSVLVATGRVSVGYALSDLIGGYIVLHRVEVERPLVHLRQDTSGAWNYRMRERPPSPTNTPRPPRPPGSGPSLGDVVVVESLTVRDGIFRVSDPWRPDASLRGVARDSAIREALARADSSVRRVGTGFVQTRHWTALQLEAPYVRLKYPDSAGVALRIARLNVHESSPPFDLRNAAGSVNIANDTVHLDISRFELPGSAGSARGTVVNKDGLAIGVRVVADTVSLADVAWLMPTFPTEGGGRMVLDIRKSRRSDVTEYALTRLDVQTTASRLTGAMTFRVGGPVLAVTNVDLELAPVDFKLLEHFSGEPLPMPWAGQLRGRVVGPGGPLDRFIIDETTIAFTDANVPGVVNRFRGAGELDVLLPAFTAFHDFALEVEHLDFRTLQAVNPKFPPLLGTVAGRARLDSVWTDVRFREADITHTTNAQLPVSRFAGAGRMTLTESDLFYDLDIEALPISLDALAASYPKMPLRGSFSGPLAVNGWLGDLAVGGELVGSAGRISADLRIDALAPSFRAEGRLNVFDFDPSRVLDSAAALRGALTGSAEFALTGDSLTTLDGGVRIHLARSELSDVRIHDGRVNATFGGGLMRLDTVALETSAGRVYGGGGLGLSSARADSVRLEITVDSLGGLRPFIARVSDSVAVDSLGGSMTATARLRGSVDNLDLDVTARGREVVRAGMRVDRFSLRALFTDVTGAASGDATLDADGATVGGIRFRTAHVDVQSPSPGRASIGAQLRTADNVGLTPGATVNALTSVTWDSLEVATRLESVGVAIGSHRWRLASPGTIVAAKSGITINSLELVDDGRGRITIDGTVPTTEPIRLDARVESLSLTDVGALMQATVPVNGQLTGTASITGTRDMPRIEFDATAINAQVGEATVQGLHLFGSYGDRVLRPTLEYRGREGEVVMTASAALPVDLALTPVADRLLDLPLEGTLRADSTALAVMETFSNVFTSATGKLDANLTLGGTWTQPRVTGRLAIVNGGLGLPRLGAVRLQNMQARVRFFGDSLRIDTLTAQSGETPANRMRAFGGLRFADLKDPYFEEIRFIADRFRIIDKPGVADLEVTGALRLVGPMSRATLSGADTIVINRNIYIPDAVKKDVVSLDDPEFFSLTDTSMFTDRRVLPSAPARMVENLTVENVVVAAGPNLWLRSNEADIKLGGALQLRTGPSQRRGQEGQRQLVLDGALNAEPGGTYRLSLGPIQKTFITESGTIRFFGQPDINPSVEISALHTVRQYDQRAAQQEVRIRVTLEGTLARMTATLSSPDSLRISNADLISYLATGAPDFSIGGRTSDYTTTAARIAIGSLGSVLGSSLAGGVVDVVDVRTSGLEGYSGDARSVGGSILSGTRIGAGKQLGDKAFLRADFGLCQVGQVASGDQSFDPVAFANSVGVKLDYRLQSNVGVSLGLEPPTSALLCASGAAARGFVPTPRQWSLDLFRLWRF